MDPIFIFFLVMLVFMYLLLIRPQRQQAKRTQEMLENLKLGDEVITAGRHLRRHRRDRGRARLARDRRGRRDRGLQARDRDSRPAEEAAELSREEPEEAPEPRRRPSRSTFEEPEPVAEEQTRR